jgi:hypothetical protein
MEEARERQDFEDIRGGMLCEIYVGVVEEVVAIAQKTFGRR